MPVGERLQHLFRLRGGFSHLVGQYFHSCEHTKYSYIQSSVKSSRRTGSSCIAMVNSLAPKDFSPKRGRRNLQGIASARRVFRHGGLCAVCLLGACTVGPDYHAPDAHAPGDYAQMGDAPMPADQHLVAARSPDGRWWEEFRAPALNRLVELALADNGDVAAAKARLAEVREQVASAEGALLPQVSLGGEVGRRKYGVTMFGPVDIVVPPYTYYSGGPGVSIPLDIFGGQKRTVEENEARAEYERYELDATYLSLTEAVVEEAFSYASAKAESELLRNVVADDRRNVELTQLTFDVGTATRPQLLAAKSRLGEDEAMLPDVEARQAASRHALAVLVGKAPADFAPPDFALDDFALPSGIPASLPSALAHRRPDIEAAEAQLRAASAAVGVATADLFPKVDLAASYALQSLTPASFFSGAGAGWSAAATLTQPIFDGGQLLARRRAAEDAYSAALDSYRQTVVKSFGDVADRLEALSLDADGLRADAASAQDANDALALAHQSYAAGDASNFNVLEADRTASANRMALIRARAARLTDTANLFVALGGRDPDDGEHAPK